MNDRAIDYYVKGLEFDRRQELFAAIERINASKIEKLLEKNMGYPIYRSMGLTDEEIKHQEEIGTKRFMRVNELMTLSGRKWLFPEPDDTYKSSVAYVHLMKKQSKEELSKEFGCSWEDYMP
ncbi:MAG: hypothetical protein J6C82_06030 [Clostridia bacterium]|nr:hypothetical protein [Clostridia bacterium]